MPNSSPMKLTCAAVSRFATHLTLPFFGSLMHRFNSLQRSPSGCKRAVAFGQPGSFLYRAMVLFDDVVEILALAQTHSPRKAAFRLQRINGSRIGPILVHIDHTGHRITGATQSLAKETFRCRSVPLGRQQKLDGLTGGIHGSVRCLSWPLTFI